MKSPFVSRLALDRAIEASTAANQRALLAEARAAAVEARYDVLLDKFTALRVAGAVSEPAPIVPSTVHPTEARDDDLFELIDERAGDNPRVRRMMLRQLARDRRANIDEQTIRAAILAGVQMDGVPE